MDCSRPSPLPYSSRCQRKLCWEHLRYLLSLYCSLASATRWVRRVRREQVRPIIPVANGVAMAHLKRALVLRRRIRLIWTMSLSWKRPGRFAPEFPVSSREHLFRLETASICVPGRTSSFLSIPIPDWSAGDSTQTCNRQGLDSGIPAAASPITMCLTPIHRQTVPSVYSRQPPMPD